MIHTLGVDDDHFYLTSSKATWEDRLRLYSKEKLADALDKLCENENEHILMYSSSIDFPEDSTDVQWILDICEKLRGS